MERITREYLYTALAECSTNTLHYKSHGINKVTESLIDYTESLEAKVKELEAKLQSVNCSTLNIELTQKVKELEAELSKAKTNVEYWKLSFNKLNTIRKVKE